MRRTSTRTGAGTARGWLAVMFVAAAAVAIGACAQPAPIEGAGCNEAHPCPSGYDCEGQRCYRFQPARWHCDADSQCPLGRCNHARVCGCEDDGDCNGSSCLQSGPFKYQCGCASDAECPSGACLATGACQKSDEATTAPEGTTGGAGP